jgi:hypothetical protein
VLAGSRRRAGAVHATVRAAHVGQGLRLGQLAPSSREEQRGGRRQAPAWPWWWMIEPGTGSSQPGEVAGRASGT